MLAGMRFAKLHGLGNDFILLDLREGGELPTPARAEELCDRHRGVGADGVLSLLPAAGGARLVVHNADGSRPEMCGNGARAAALWLATSGCTRSAEPGAVVLLETDAGARPCAVWAEGPARGEVEVAMGRAVVDAPRELPLGGFAAPAWPVSVGNPHRVLFLDVPKLELLRLAEEKGPVLCRAESANIELVSRLGPQRYAAVVFERGAGLTQACGTGACAVAAAAVARGEARAGEPIEVQLLGGALSITVAADLSELRMRGPAQLVYRGELP
jgi:diaminopimelate epimerase